MIKLASTNIFSAEFWSLYNTNLIVGIGFVIFVAFLIYKGVPKLLTGLLDKRAEGIRAELDEARRLRDEAQELFAEYERKMADVENEANAIVESAKRSAEIHAQESEAKLAAQLERRIASGKEQIASAEASVERQIRSRASSIAVEAAREVLSEQLKGKKANDLIAAAIDDVSANLN